MATYCPVRVERLAIAGRANQRPVSSTQTRSSMPRAEGVLHLIGNALAAIALRRLLNRIDSAFARPVASLAPLRIGCAFAK